MPRRFKLSYDKSTNYWFKYIKNSGKYEKKYFGRGPAKYADIKYYKAALAKYEEWLAIEDDPKRLMEKAARKELTRLRKANRKQRGTSVKPRRKSSVEGVFDRYMNYQMSLGKIGDNQRQGSKTLVTAFNVFIKDFLRGGATADGLHDIRMLNDEKIKHYATYLRTRVQRKTYAVTTARMYLNFMKKFCLWAYENRFIDEFRGFTTIHIGGSAKKETPAVWTLDEIKHFWNGADDFVRTMIIIAANTGFTNMDIGDIKLGHLELDKDGKVIRITKRRTKTGVWGTYLLWDETSRRITEQYNRTMKRHKKYLDKETPLFRTNRNEKICKVRIKHVTPSATNITTRTIGTHDKIGEQARRYLRPLRKAGVVRPNLTMKHFRKTSATQIHEMVFKDGDISATLITQIFLSHTPPTVAERNYVKTDKAKILDPYLLRLEAFYKPVWT